MISQSIHWSNFHWKRIGRRRETDERHTLLRNLKKKKKNSKLKKSIMYMESHQTLFRHYGWHTKQSTDPIFIESSLAKDLKRTSDLGQKNDRTVDRTVAFFAASSKILPDSEFVEIHCLRQFWLLEMMEVIVLPSVVWEDCRYSLTKIVNKNVEGQINRIAHVCAVHNWTRADWKSNFQKSRNTRSKTLTTWCFGKHQTF
jgi:hypothetical protein